MRFRPCIDIHNGKIKQIVGGSLADKNDYAVDNFVSEKNGEYYARLYHEAGLAGGHIILLNPESSPYYEEDVRQAESALLACPGELQIGGGMNDKNASRFLEMGASHVIVTSFVFRDGHIHYDNLEKMTKAVGKEHLVLDLSCRKKEGAYYIVTDRWQKFTEERLTEQLLDALSKYCDEYLIHAVDVEGKASGIEEEVAGMLGNWGGGPVTYAGGVGSLEDVRRLKVLGKDKVDVTIGSALDLFGGTLPMEEVLRIIHGLA
ncbi:MAG: phosphoribosylformimino-5-aminoimidazole carboxamide ribotide isomerase [Eubacteriales bacterium]|nr:phosphoribosylformimino-5-aminoimidazole carboxamide ribotide isomerase [Eubacteriales bacterium]